MVYLCIIYAETYKYVNLFRRGQALIQWLWCHPLTEKTRLKFLLLWPLNGRDLYCHISFLTVNCTEGSLLYRTHYLDEVQYEVTHIKKRSKFLLTSSRWPGDIILATNITVHVTFSPNSAGVVCVTEEAL